MSLFGTISYGVKAPIIRKGDDLVKIVADCVIDATNEENVFLQNGDIVAVTEAVLGKAQGNYATIQDISDDVKQKFGNETVGLVFPILSRNRFSLLLKGIAGGVKKLVIMLSYPSDEVGNHLITDQKMFESGINPYTEILTEEKFREIFGETKHIFTGVDYIELYKSIAGENCEIIFANNPEAILSYTKYVINADIHTREQTKQQLLKAGAKKVFSLDEILNKSINGSGYNENYGILGSNVSTDTTIKLFPREAKEFAVALQKEFLSRTGKTLECMVYGDGAFKDPVGKIWELADPVVSPGYTDGLIGTPNEIKFKYIADNKIGNLTGKKAEEEIKKIIREKQSNLINQNVSLGTTPRRLTDLLGSLSDLTSGSGDKGTPIVLIQNYFKNYSD